MYITSELIFWMLIVGSWMKFITHSNPIALAYSEKLDKYGFAQYIFLINDSFVNKITTITTETK